MRKLTKTEIKINSKIGKAVSDYDLIKTDDRILVAVSGGKDSLTLLNMLKKIQSWAPVKFHLSAAHITTDLDDSNRMQAGEIETTCRELGMEYFVSHVDVLDDTGKTSCFWCSWNKRKALFELAKKVSCNKIAFGHHKDDIIETVLLNLFFKGEISAMNPRQELFGGELTLIRPLCYIEEELIKVYAKEKGFPLRACTCPFGQRSKRKVIKDLLDEIENKTPGTNIKTNVFNSVARIKEGYVGLKKEKELHKRSDLLQVGLSSDNT